MRIGRYSVRSRWARTRTAAVGALVAIALLAVASTVVAGPRSVKSEHWGVITRNTIGSPVADLRSGPYGSFGVTGPAARPPFGKGSLGIAVADAATAGAPPSEKVDFGNEVDFFGDPVLGLNEVGFHVFQTGENATPNPENMPNIRFEIDPNVIGDTNDYTTMVWVPDAAPVVNQWSGYIDATSTGYWYFTGAEPPGTVCNQATQCTFALAKDALIALNNGSPPIIYTAAVGKGRDQTWVGAVDGFRLNNRVFDFEADGVFARGSGRDNDGDDDDDDD